MAHLATRIAACVALVAALAPPALGDPKKLRSEGCLAVGSHSIAPMGIRPYDCTFIATGPSYYVASTTNPFVISIWDKKIQRYVDVVRRSSAGAPSAGIVETKSGDQVAVSISCWDYTANTWCKDAIGGRYGVIAIHSRL